MPDQKITITYYTDPYCTWCWGSEPILRHIKEVYSDQVKIEIKMGGLVENMDDFYDPSNQISSMAQVAPHWLEASGKHGMPVEESIFTDPDNDFDSTYPANIAFKAAQFQSDKLAERFLRRMREATSSEHKFIHKMDVLADLADEVGLDKERFKKDFISDEAKDAFYGDLNEARSQGISGFPTFILKGDNGEDIIFHGYRKFDAFTNAFEKLSKIELKKSEPESILDFIKKWQKVSTQEVAEVFGLSKEESYKELANFEAKAKIKKISLGNGEFWEDTSN